MGSSQKVYRCGVFFDIFWIFFHLPLKRNNEVVDVVAFEYWKCAESINEFEVFTVSFEKLFHGI